jgi:carboxylesterase type B
MHSLLRYLLVLVIGLGHVSATRNATIAAGTIYGTTCSNGPSAFLSIPYAKPPTGDLRWTAPQAYNQMYPTSGYNASTKGAACIQFGSQFLETGKTSEDW